MSSPPGKQLREVQAERQRFVVSTLNRIEKVLDKVEASYQAAVPQERWDEVQRQMGQCRADLGWVRTQVEWGLTNDSTPTVLARVGSLAKTLATLASLARGLAWIWRHVSDLLD